MFESKKLRTVRCRILRSELIFFWEDDALQYMLVRRGEEYFVSVRHEMDIIEGDQALYTVFPFVRMYLRDGIEVLVRNDIFEIL